MLSLGEKSKSDDANRKHDGGLAETGDRVQASRLLEREFKADETPARKELTREGEIQEVGDAGAGVHGEKILSDQSGIVGSVEKLGDFDDLGKKQSLYASDSTLPHDPSQDRSDQGDLSAFTNSTFEAGSQDTSSGNKEGRDVDMEEPLSLGSQTEADSLQGDQPIPFSPDNRGKDRAEDQGESFEQRKSRLAAAANQAEDFEDAEMSSRADDNAQKEKPELLQDGEENQLTLTRDGNAQKQREEMGDGSYGTGTILTAPDGVLRDQEEHVGTAESTPTRDQDGQDHGKHSDPTVVAGDGMDYKGAGATLSKTGPAADVISGKPDTRRGVENFSGANRNWDGWEDVVSGEDLFGENKRSPLPQEIDDVGQPLSVEGLTSHGQSDYSVNESGPTLEKAGGVLKSDQDAVKEIGSQPEGLDRESPLDKSVNISLGDSLGSTSAHHLSPHKNWPEVMPGLDEDVGGNVPQQQTDQTNKVPLKLSTAEANWDDWDEVIKEIPMLIDGIASKKSKHPESSRERQTPGVDPLGGGDTSEPGEGKTGTILESETVEGVIDRAPARLPVHIPESERSDFIEPSVESNSRAANEAIPALAILTPKVDVYGANLIGLLSLNEDYDKGRTEGRKGVNADEEIPRHESGQAGAEIGPLAQGDWSDVEDIRKSEYVPGGSRPSSPSLEDTHDGDLSSELEYPNAHKTAVKLPIGKRRWADWEDLTKSEYMVLDGPGGESLIFKRASDARGSSLSKSLGDRESSSFEEPDDDGESPRLRSNRRQPPSFAPLKGATPGEIVTSDYSAGSLSFQGFETTTTSLPGVSPHKSEAGDKPSLVSTHRPLLYRDSRRDYTSEVEDMDVTSKPTNPIVHYHDHNLHDHEDALKYDVQKILRGQTQYDLICPVCGAVITKKIVIRKKKRRFINQGDRRWNRPSEITPVENDESKSPRSDTSSEAEDASARWKQGIRPCFGFFFGS